MSGVRIVALGVALATAGCASSQYQPYRLYGNELVLAQDDGLIVRAGQQNVAREPRWTGLDERVGCVPSAATHARAARRHGRAATALAIAGGILGVASLGSLAGLQLRHSDPAAAGAIVGTGIGLGLIGIGLAAGSRRERILANGHAVDAMNYYNDAALVGGRCR
jgi:hypothetical protein